jgi:hypothetical protein
MFNQNLIDFPKKTTSSYQASFANIKARFATKDFYDNYIKYCVIKDIEPKFTSIEYKNFTEYFNDYFITTLITTGRIYELPCSLGILGVLKKQSQVKIPN